MKYLNPISIEATTLPDAWFQAIYRCLEIGRDFIIDQGSFQGDKRLEFDYITAHIKRPFEEPMLPQLPAHYNLPNPVADDFMNEYMPYLMTGESKPGESYTYGQRIMKYPLGSKRKVLKKIKKGEDIYIQDKEIWNNPKIIIQEKKNFFRKELFINQMELLIWTYKNKGHRNNQMVMQVAHPSDMSLQDPPCLRQIDTRVQDNKLHFFPYFRSWDLWGGFPANLCAIEQMKQYIAGEIGVENGEMIVSSKGLHIYDYVWELAETIRGKTIDEFRKGKW